MMKTITLDYNLLHGLGLVLVFRAIKFKGEPDKDGLIYGIKPKNAGEQLAIANLLMERVNYHRDNSIWEISFYKSEIGILIGSLTQMYQELHNKIDKGQDDRQFMSDIAFIIKLLQE
ncbi:MAG: hypothetical protein IPH33_15240 [Bacteroidetes bacterium]|nr:hypothetical protein [Bacteroidota bacterium]MBK8584461.1 hypothetical protein [Bacteroidota bacterium]